MYIQSCPEDEDERGGEESEAFADECNMSFHAGHFRRMLAQATQLRTLVLHLPKYESDGMDEVYGMKYLQEAVGSVTFPHLYDLAIGQCFTTSDYLKEFLFSHKTTLRRLALSDIHLVRPSDSWEQTFEDIAGRLP